MTPEEARKIARDILHHTRANEESTANYYARGRRIYHELLRLGYEVHESGLRERADDHGLRAQTLRQHRHHLRRYLARAVLDETDDRAAVDLARDLDTLDGQTMPRDAHPPPADRRARLSEMQEIAMQAGCADWRELMVEMMPSDVDRDLVRVIAVSGCRPSELLPGVYIEECDGDLVILVYGAKIREGRGQPVRALRLSTHAPMTAALLDQVRAAGGQRTYRLTGRQANLVNAICQRVVDNAQRRGYPASLYLLRHQFASDLRADRWSWTAIARALGHVTDECQRRYGRTGYGRQGLCGVVAVGAPEPVRHVARHAAVETYAATYDRVEASADDDDSAGPE